MRRNDDEFLSREELAQLRELIAGQGEDAAARFMGIARHTLVRVLAGLSVRRATIAVARQRITEWRESCART